nr:PREDICTED: uncharacterized protein LOC107080098 [Lepisosteus oculatus]
MVGSSRMAIGRGRGWAGRRVFVDCERERGHGHREVSGAGRTAGTVRDNKALNNNNHHSQKSGRITGCFNACAWPGPAKRSRAGRWRSAAPVRTPADSPRRAHHAPPAALARGCPGCSPEHGLCPRSAARVPERPQRARFVGCNGRLTLLANHLTAGPSISTNPHPASAFLCSTSQGPRVLWRTNELVSCLLRPAHSGTPWALPVRHDRRLLPAGGQGASVSLSHPQHRLLLPGPVWEQAPLL